MNDTDKQKEFIKVAILESTIEAQVTGAVLEEENIPHLIRSYHDTAYDGLFQFQKGWGEIRAPLSHKEEILKILDEVRSENYNNFIAEGGKSNDRL
ncbi:hypothetical protein [Desulfonema magnum]|uniref:DUF2007 domain-containing protein n=1 Tax=Desulfonema magnum TaxID=45655 RepID=A0A975GQU6_9BACT|nr:hypothetical protein [Desulfonema magnum]QTA90270.1 Uncharacterized protein dnm_063310 [Desulfonema magnum]